MFANKRLSSRFSTVLVEQPAPEDDAESATSHNWDPLAVPHALLNEPDHRASVGPLGRTRRVSVRSFRASFGAPRVVVGAPRVSLKAAAPKDSKQSARRIKWTWDILAICVVYMVEGFNDLAGTAMPYYLKDTVGLGPAESGFVSAIGQVPWNVLPLLGLITDLCPIFGSRRRVYLVLMGLAGCVSWATLPSRVDVVSVTIAMLLGCLSSAWARVVADSVSVKLSQGQTLEVAACIQSLSWVNYTAGALLGGPVTGWVLEKYGTRPVFLITSACMLAVALSGFMISEKDAPGQTTNSSEGLETPLLNPCQPAGNGDRCAAGDAGAPVVGPSSTSQSLRTLVSGVWQTLNQPYIAGPALFIFLWQCTPAPTSAMFYFQTNVLQFGPGFMEFMYVCGTLSGFLGVLVYNLLLSWSLRSILLWCALLGNALNASQLLLVSRYNLKLHLSDKLFSLGDYSMLYVLAEVMLTPMLALAARACPEGIEATVPATLCSLLNLSTVISAASGAALTSAFHVTDSNFDHMFALTLLCNLLMFAPLPVLCMVPSNLTAPDENETADQAQPDPSVTALVHEGTLPHVAQGPVQQLRKKAAAFEAVEEGQEEEEGAGSRQESGVGKAPSLIRALRAPGQLAGLVCAASLFPYEDGVRTGARMDNQADPSISEEIVEPVGPDAGGPQDSK